MTGAAGRSTFSTVGREARDILRRLAVPAHVHVCADGEHVVFLDLKSDRYWALPAASTRGFSVQVGRWSLRTGDDDERAPDPSMLEMLRAKGLLCDEAVLTDDAQVGEPDREVAQARAACRDVASIAPLNASIAVHPVSFLLSAAVAAATLKGRGLQHAVARTRERRLRRARENGRDFSYRSIWQPSRTAVPDYNLEAVIALAAGFERLRPLLFSARDACLFHSFVLIEFLARHDCYPHWVFGVRARPFAAHCWVQLDDIVLNDGVEHVSRYTPILVA